MRILHVCPLPLFSGLEQYALLLAKEQARLGHSVGFVVQKNSHLEREVAASQLEMFTVDVYGAKNTFSGALQYRSILKSQSKCDVVHLHSSQDIERMGLAFLLMKQTPNWHRPKLIQQNHIWISHSKRTPLHWLKYSALDEVWCSSEPARRDLERHLPVAINKIHVVRYGRDLAIRESFLPKAEARQQLAIDPDATVIGAIARIDKAKGIWELIHGSVECWKAGLDFHLAIIGGPTLTDPDSVTFAKQVDEFLKALPPNLAKRIRMTGGIPDAGKFLRAFDIYAQASYKETFSLALLDAQLAERPVIGTTSGGTPEVVREGLTGWLAEPQSINSMAATIRRALSDREKWSAFGHAAQARVESDFDLIKVIDAIIDRYQISS